MSKLKLIYLYIFSTVGLVLVIIGSVSLINLGLKAFIFKNADYTDYYRTPSVQKIIIDKETGKEEILNQELTEEDIKNQEEQDKKYKNSQRQRDASQALAFIIIGLPVYAYHWSLVRKKDS